MIFGIPVEIRSHENRVGAAPFVVEELVKRGHQVLVESKAGILSGYSDELYERAGAVLVPSAEKLYAQAQFILKVGEPVPVEYELILPEHTIFAYFYFSTNLEMSRSLLARGCSCYAYEAVEEPNGLHPLLSVERQIVGQLAVLHGASCLHTQEGGRGVMLGFAPGVQPAQVVVLGAADAGTVAAAYAARLGARVFLLESDFNLMQKAKLLLPPNASVMTYHEHNLHVLLPQTDLLISAMQNGMESSPAVLLEEDVQRLPEGAVIVDLNIDFGGSVETSHATTHENPTFVKHGVVHYCVPNLAGSVPRTASEALSSVLLPILTRFAEGGFPQVLRGDDSLLKGLAMYEGRATDPRLAEALGVPFYDFKANGD